MNLSQALLDYLDLENEKQTCIFKISKYMADEEANNDRLSEIDRDYIHSEYYEKLSNMKMKAISFKILKENREKEIEKLKNS